MASRRRNSATAHATREASHLSPPNFGTTHTKELRAVAKKNVCVCADEIRTGIDVDRADSLTSEKRTTTAQIRQRSLKLASISSNKHDLLLLLSLVSLFNTTAK